MFLILAGRSESVWWGEKNCATKKMPLICQSQNINLHGTCNVSLVSIGENYIYVKTMYLLKKQQKHHRKCKSVIQFKSRRSCRYIQLICLYCTVTCPLPQDRENFRKVGLKFLTSDKCVILYPLIVKKKPHKLWKWKSWEMSWILYVKSTERKLPLMALAYTKNTEFWFAGWLWSVIVCSIHITGVGRKFILECAHVNCFTCKLANWRLFVK